MQGISASQRRDGADYPDLLQTIRADCRTLLSPERSDSSNEQGLIIFEKQHIGRQHIQRRPGYNSDNTKRASLNLSLSDSLHTSSLSTPIEPGI